MTCAPKPPPPSPFPPLFSYQWSVLHLGSLICWLWLWTSSPVEDNLPHLPIGPVAHEVLPVTVTQESGGAPSTCLLVLHWKLGPLEHLAPISHGAVYNLHTAGITTKIFFQGVRTCARLLWCKNEIDRPPPPPCQSHFPLVSLYLIYTSLALVMPPGKERPCLLVGRWWYGICFCGGFSKAWVVMDGAWHSVVLCLCRPVHQVTGANAPLPGLPPRPLKPAYLYSCVLWAQALSPCLHFSQRLGGGWEGSVCVCVTCRQARPFTGVYLQTRLGVLKQALACLSDRRRETR